MQDRSLQMQSLVLDTVNLLQKLAFNIGSLLILFFQEPQESKQQQLKIKENEVLKQKLEHTEQENKELKQELEQKEQKLEQTEQENEVLRIERKALRDRNMELEDIYISLNGEEQSLSDFYDRDEDDLEIS